jgi:hypothetical protein
MRSPMIGVIFVVGLLILITPLTLGLLLPIPLHAHYAILVSGECPTSFFAEDVTKDDFRSLDFYFTGRSIGSAADCARYCGKRQFCRTAVYDQSASTCAISYGWRTSCSRTSSRFNSFTSQSVGLVAIACVDYCPSDDRNAEPGTYFLSNRYCRTSAVTIALPFFVTIRIASMLTYLPLQLRTLNDEII